MEGLGVGKEQSLLKWIQLTTLIGMPTQTNGTWDVYQDIEFWAGHEINQPGQDSCVDHVANALIAAIGEVGQGPAGIREDLAVFVLQEVG